LESKFIQPGDMYDVSLRLEPRDYVPPTIVMKLKRKATLRD